MALLDIMGEIAERQSRQSETGGMRIPGVMIGIVTDNYNKDKPGCVRVKVPVRDEDANILKWAKVARPYSGKGWSWYFHPEKDDQVLLAFEHGNLDAPYIIASLPRDNDGVISKASDEDNQTKEIVTRNGSRLIFTDHKDGGEKDRIQIQTSGETCQLLLDNENKKIAISDKDKNCVIEMKLKDGSIQVAAAKKFTLSVGDTIKISMNGSNGTVSIEADKVAVAASRAMELKSDGSCKMSGQQTVIEASSMLKESSNGMVTIAGSPIKLG